jgi:hypothetical protein
MKHNECQMTVDLQSCARRVMNHWLGDLDVLLLHWLSKGQDLFRAVLLPVISFAFSNRLTGKTAICSIAILLRSHLVT